MFSSPLMNECYESAFGTYFDTIHHHKTNRLCNITRLFDHLATFSKFDSNYIMNQETYNPIDAEILVEHDEQGSCESRHDDGGSHESRSLDDSHKLVNHRSREDEHSGHDRHSRDDHSSRHTRFPNPKYSSHREHKGTF